MIKFDILVISSFYVSDIITNVSDDEHLLQFYGWTHGWNVPAGFLLSLGKLEGK